MSRLLASLGVLACALCLAPGASAVARAHPSRAVVPARVATGSVTAAGSASVTITTIGRRAGIANAMIAAAGAITRRDYPYVWGGGHASAGVASVGMRRGPGANGRRVGFDCSGSVAAVLVAGGLWPAGGGVPSELGVIHQLLAEHLIAPGPGLTPTEVTLYDEPGVHIFMNINGRFFGTSDGGGGGSRRGGPGWLDDGAPDAWSRAFHQYHVLASALRDSSADSHTFTLTAALPGVLAGVAVGDRVRATFRPGHVGTLALLGLTWVGEQTATGVVTAVASDDSGFTVLTPGGQSLAFTVPAATAIAARVALGDQVAVAYTTHGRLLSAHTITVTAEPTELQAAGTVTALAPDLSSVTIQPATGPAVTVVTAGNPGLLHAAALGDQVQVYYIAAGPTLILQSISVLPAGPPSSAAAR